MKNKQDPQTDVQNAIIREQLLNASEIGVTAKDGVVSLTGVVVSYSKKMEVENAAIKVIGVKALSKRIKVKFLNSWSKTDAEIANEVLTGLKNNYSAQNEKVTVKVENGRVPLEGELRWNYQKGTAKSAVNYLEGVISVTNNITIKSDCLGTIEKKDVKAAITRSWSDDDSDINVSVLETTVTLTGTVDSWYQKEEAGRIAWKTSDIWHVKNELEVDYEYAFS